MANFQQITILGRIGKDPEVVTTKNNNKIGSVSMAVSEGGYKKANGEDVPQTTEWFSLVFFGNQAEILEKYVHKGDMLFVVGKLRTESYDKNGEKRYVTKVVVNQMQLMPKGGESNAPSNDAPKQPTTPPVDFGNSNDELPF